MKKGDKVRCVNTGTGYIHITLGEIYEISKVESKWLSIYKNDYGTLNCPYLKSCFELIKEENEMKKSDLKSGYILVDEKDEKWLIFEISNKLIPVNIVDKELNFSRTINIEFALDENLKNTANMYNPSCDIAKVYGLSSHIHRLFELSDRELLWQRNETKEMTVEEISKALGYKVKVVK